MALYARIAWRDVAEMLCCDESALRTFVYLNKRFATIDIHRCADLHEMEADQVIDAYIGAMSPQERLNARVIYKFRRGVAERMLGE